MPRHLFSLLVIGLCLATRPDCAAMDAPSGESALGFAQRVFAEVEAKDVTWLLGHATTTDRPGRREALEKALTEWLDHQKRFGWRLTVLSEHGDNLRKMVVLKQGDHIDPLFCVRKDETSPWKLVIHEEDHFLGADNVIRLRNIFRTIDDDFRKNSR